ncbi:hypothetical protein TMatcc_011274 [Talaromyces marneffei ATCC 18224]
MAIGIVVVTVINLAETGSAIKYDLALFNAHTHRWQRWQRRLEFLRALSTALLAERTFWIITHIHWPLDLVAGGAVDGIVGLAPALGHHY